MKKFLLLAGLALTVAVAAEAGVLKIELPLETAVFKPAPGVNLANAQCLTCHSADYMATQPPKPRDFWKAEVDKMKAKYGAPIPAAQMDPLTDYFARNYGTDTGAPAATTNILASAGDNGGKIDVLDLANRVGCLNCHKVDTKLVGPAYKDVAEKYRGNPGGLDKVEHQITHGGAGQWGQMPMPPFQLTPAEVDALAHWVLSQ